MFRAQFPRQRRAARVVTMLTLLVLFTGLFARPASAQPTLPAPVSAPATVPAADPGTVTFMRDLFGSGQIGPADEWLIGGGYLYWAQCYNPNPNIAPQSSEAQPNAAPAGYLRRWPVRGGAIATLSNAAFCATASWAADDSGLYYQDGSLIYRRSLANPFTPVAVVSTGGYALSGPLVLDGANLFYIINNYIYSTPKAQIHSNDPQNQDATLPIVEGGANATGLIVNGNVLNWFGGGHVRSVDKTCTVVCTANDLATEPGAYLSNASIANYGGFSRYSNPLWVAGPITDGAYPLAGNRIRSYSCRSTSTGISCGAGTAYAEPDGDYSDGTKRPWAIGPMASDGDYLFWVEDLKICKTDMFGITSCAAGAVGRLMKYHIRLSPIGSPPDQFDTPQPIASMNSSGVFSMSGTPPVAVADGWVYFDTSNGLSRIRADAPPLSWDLAFNGWEITQGIQNLNNDVPLVANKPTYVRVYGTKLNGPSASNVEAILHGMAGNGAPLGLLRSMNGPQNFAANNGTPDRAAANGGWLFQLPDSWANAGTLKLSVQIDPRGVFNDPNRGNNNSASNQSFTFTRKAPVCAVFVPVRTVAPRASTNDPNFWQMIERFKTLWPVSDVWVYHQDEDVAELEIKWGGPGDLIPYPGYGPYELDEGGSLFNGIISDKDKVIISLIERDVLSDDPDECDDANARTHYVGMVHPDAPTSTTSGYANYEWAVSWVKFPPHDGNGLASRFSLPKAGDTMAQELSHNYNGVFGDRWKHVNCGGPDGINPNYPYDPCKLDDRARTDPAAHFGFDPLTLTPIAPDMASDYMSYGSTNWVSDYSWRGMFGEVKNNAVTAQQIARAPADQPIANLSDAAHVVLVSGIVTPTAQRAELNNAWVLPSSSLGASALRKWQALAAPAAHVQHEGEAAHYQLRLLDSTNAVLCEHEVVATGGTHGIITDTLSFVTTFPAPAGQVARMELRDGDKVLGSLNAGSTPPSVSIISPAGGETVDDQMTLSWRASDPDQTDRLLFSVQYSPDNGTHWRSLLTDFPNRSGTDTVTLSLKGLSGIPASTSGGLIRVAASDGYNTTLSTSQPFTVVNRAPAPHIDAPGNSPLPAGQTIVVNGGATDVEDGGLSGDSLHWALDSVDIGNGQAQTIEGLAPGSHTLTLTARDSAGKEATATQTLTVAPLAIPKAAPVFDGDCNDDAYANAARVPLAPYADGTQAFVSLVRTDDALYACFAGMQRTSGSSPGTLALVRVNSDYGRRSAPDANDRAFYTDEAGVVTTFKGNGTTYVAGDGGVSAQISANATTWNAELRIDASVVGGMHHVIGLDVEQAWVNTNNDRSPWPQRAGYLDPSSWGAAALGDVPQISDVTPASAPVGTGDTAITLNGSAFAAGATMQFNGTALATTVISATQLQATIPAASLATAGMVNVTVVNPGLEAAPSNALPFSVTNPLPQLSQARLTGKTLTLTGNSFVSGATVQFNGNDYVASGDGTQISVTVSDADLIGSDAAPVTVYNPGPGGGVSNVVTLGAAPVAGGARLYLPILER